MNDRAALPPEPQAPQRPARTQSGVTGRDREFLPAALEILESPPPPLPVVMMMTICLFFAAALAWSFIGRLDVHAVAQGKIERVGRAKVIEPLDPGKIAAVHINVGDHVKAGEPLIDLDPAETMADAAAQDDAANASLAEMARRRAEIEIARSIERDIDLGLRGVPPVRASIERIAADPVERIAWNDAVPQSFRIREGTVLTADLFQLADALDDLDKQVAQKEATRERLTMSISYEETLIQTLIDRVNTRQKAIDLAVGTKINLYDAKESLQKSQASLASDRGQLIETDAAREELAAQKFKTISQFVADSENKLLEAARKADEAREGFAKANARLEHTRLVSPIDGIVQQMSVTTIGQVVTPGQELAVVVPSNGELQVEALIANLDIGFVKLGQEVAVKIDAFPFTRFGVLHGKVTRIAAEAIDEQTAKRSLSDATAASYATMPSSATAPGQAPTFVFPVTIALESPEIKINGVAAQLSPGMTVTAEIKTDSRRIIDYLFSPLAKMGSEALRER